jgi:[protein-PII] uridylyltransferase
MLSLILNARNIYQQLMQLYHICNIKTACMIAVGGLGRNKQYPQSDLDIVFIYADNINTQQDIQAIELFIQKAWDLKWHISPQVLSIDEFSNYIQNWECATAFLDAVYMRGSKNIFFKVKYNFIKWLKHEKLNFIAIKHQELIHRHLNCPLFALEPNCKEHAGALRDIDYMHWVCKILRIPNHPFYLQFYLGMTKAELKEQRKQFKFLSELRYHLHLITHKKEDILRFEYQNQLAHAMGYQNDNLKLAQEYLMRAYFRCTRTIYSLRKQFDYLIQNYIHNTNISTYLIQKQHITSHLNTLHQYNNFEYFVHENCIHVTSENAFIQKPNTILDCFYLLNHYDDLSILTQRALFKAKQYLNDAWRNHCYNIQQFLTIIRSQHVVKILNSMHQHSILGRYLIFFRNIIGQMQHDLLHIYTVDQHTIKVLDYLYAFQKIDYTYQSESISQISQKFQPYWLLYIAALFHDLGKGQGGNHSKIGAEYTEHFCKQHKLSIFYRKTLVWLVLHHLLLSHSVQHLDIHNKNQIIDFCKQLNIYIPRCQKMYTRFKAKLNVRRNIKNTQKCYTHVKNTQKHIFLLQALYLLTIADIQGTNPKAYNTWRATLIQNFFSACMHYLNTQNNVHSLAPALSPQIVKQNIINNLSYLPQSNVCDWLSTLQATFFMRHSVQHIIYITKFLADFNFKHKNCVYVYDINNINDSVNTKQDKKIWHIWVHAQDVQYLFVHICKILAKYNINIIHADLDHTNYQFALNYIQVDCTYYMSKYDTSNQMQNLENIYTLQRILEQNILDEINQPHFQEIPINQLKHHSHYSARVRQFVAQNKATILYSEQRCILQIKTIDHIGLLYKVALILAKKNINIQQAHIITMGEHVEDVFVIKHPSLQNNNTLLNLEVDILNTINQ